MVNTEQILPNITWVGASDRRLSRFENLFPLPNGVSYNSYLITDDKCALLDTTDVSVRQQLMENVMHSLNGRKLDYLVLHHVEPDHCSQVQALLDIFPECTLVGNAQTFKLLCQFFSGCKCANQLIVKEGDTLDLGQHQLTFYMAPMVHWPETMVSYETSTGTLFSADAFGTFGACDAGIFADRIDFAENYLLESRRYYSNIVGKYGAPVQAAMKKISGLNIKMICSLHGPVWRKNIDYFLDKYQKWSTYTPEEEGYVVAYGTMYGHTESAAQKVAAMIQHKSNCPVSVYDVSETHYSYIISDIWRFSNVVLFSPTYNGGIYLAVESLIEDIIALGVMNRRFFIAENGSWAPMAGKQIKEKLSVLKNCQVSDNILTIKGALHAEDEQMLEAWTDAVVAK